MAGAVAKQTALAAAALLAVSASVMGGLVSGAAAAPGAVFAVTETGPKTFHVQYVVPAGATVTGMTINLSTDPATDAVATFGFAGLPPFTTQGAAAGALVGYPLNLLAGSTYYGDGTTTSTITPATVFQIYTTSNGFATASKYDVPLSQAGVSNAFTAPSGTYYWYYGNSYYAYYAYYAYYYVDVSGAGTVWYQYSPSATRMLSLAAVEGRAVAKPLIQSGKVVARQAGKVKLTLRPTAAGRAVLKQKGFLKVRLKIMFGPTGGTPASKIVSLTLRAKK
jgi:hypothetical protein